MWQIGGGKENKAQVLRGRNQRRNMVGRVDCKCNLRAGILILLSERPRRLHLQLFHQEKYPDQR